MTTTMIWNQAETKSLITLRPIQGYQVQLTTRCPVGSDYTRETYRTTELTATDRVGWLMDLVPGEWKRVTKLGRVITGRAPLWSSDSGTPDPITRKPDLFPTFPSCNEDDF